MALGAASTASTTLNNLSLKKMEDAEPRYINSVASRSKVHELGLMCGLGGPTYCYPIAFGNHILYYANCIWEALRHPDTDCLTFSEPDKLGCEGLWST